MPRINYCCMAITRTHAWMPSSGELPSYNQYTSREADLWIPEKNAPCHHLSKSSTKLLNTTLCHIIMYSKVWICQFENVRWCLVSISPGLRTFPLSWVQRSGCFIIRTALLSIPLIHLFKRRMFQKENGFQCPLALNGWFAFKITWCVFNPNEDRGYRKI